MKKLNPLSLDVVALLILACACGPAQAATITLNGGQTNQYVDGFGVNANYWSYTNSDLNPVLDALIDQAGMTLFRVVFNNGWETDNDNGDPNVLNQSYYNTLYDGPEFQKLWGLLAHLEQKGLSNGIVLNFQGPGPTWMGGNTIASGMEDEWAEMIVSLLLYARTNQHLNFHLVAPDNEPDIASEGIYVPTAAQYVTMLRNLAQKLDAYGLSDFRFVVPDRTGGTDFFPEIMNDPVIMAKVAHFGIHSYVEGGQDTDSVCALVDQTQFRDRKVWVTEFNVWCQSCETEGQGTNGWEYFRETADYLLDHLDHGASAGIVWEGYDSFYPHHDAWSLWGLFAVDDTNAISKTYTPRKGFYTLSQITKFASPGSRRIEVTGLPASLKASAFYNDDLGQLTLIGINIGAGAANLAGTFLALPALGTFDLYYTTSGMNLAQGSVQLNSNSFNTTIPGDCIFTLTGVDAAKLLLSVHLISPVDGAQYDPPATISLQATANTSTGSISKVEFFSGSTKLGEDTMPPYGFTWTNVPVGVYIVTARASNTAGIMATSSVVRIVVPGEAAQIVVSPACAIVFPNGAQQFSASAMDAFGAILQPQPSFAWSAAGGTIDFNGLYAAGPGIGGPFVVTANSRGIAGSATIYVATNLAFAGAGYTWYGLPVATGDSPRTAAAGINDADFSTDVPLRPGGAVDSANAYEAAGIVWPVAQTVRQIIYRNGSWTFDDNGVFAANLQLQFSSDGTTWTAAGPEWLVSPAYVYNSPLSGNTSFTFQGGTNSVRGVRCVGRVHTSEAASPPNSWVAYAREMQVFNVEIATAAPLLSAVVISNSVVISWPSSAEGYILEATATVNPTSAWSVVTNPPQQLGQEQRVTIIPTETQRFFRLRLQ